MAVDAVVDEGVYCSWSTLVTGGDWEEHTESLRIASRAVHTRVAWHRNEVRTEVDRTYTTLPLQRQT